MIQPCKNKDESQTILKERFGHVTSQQVTLTCSILMLRARPRNSNEGQTAGQPTGQVQHWPSPHSSKPASQNHKHMMREGESAFAKTSSSCLRRQCSWANRASEEGGFPALAGQRHFASEVKPLFPRPMCMSILGGGGAGGRCSGGTVDCELWLNLPTLAASKQLS